MGFVLKYCVICGARIPEEDLDSGVALEWQQKTYCRDHVPAEAAAARQRRNSAPAVARIRRQSGRTAALTPSGRHLEAGRRESGRTAALRDRGAGIEAVGDGDRRSNFVPVAVIGVAVLAVVGALGVILASGGGSRDTPTGTGEAGSPTGSPDDGANVNSGDPTASQLQQLNQRTREELDAWRRFSASPPAEPRATAITGFDRTQKLVADSDDYARRVADDRARRLPSDRVHVLSSLLDNWCQAATADAIRDIRELADLTARSGTTDDALRLIGDILQGRNRELLDRRFLDRLPDGRDSWAARELHALVTQLRNRGSAGATPDAPRSAESAAETALLDLLHESRAWSDDQRMDERWFDEGLDWFARLVGLPEAHPAIENSLPPDGNPGTRYRAAVRTMADRLFAFLDQQWRALDRADQPAVDGFVSRARAFLERAPSWLPAHGTVLGWQRELLRQRVGPTGDGAAALVARLEQAERDARAALSATGFHELLRAFARLQLAQSLVVVADARQQQLLDLQQRLHARYWEQLEATVGNVANTPRQASWRAAGFHFFCMSGTMPATQPYQARIQQLSGRFGPHPVSDYRAMLQFLEDARNGDDPGGDTSDALWMYYQTLAEMLARVYQQQPDDAVLELIGAARSVCVQVALRRDVESMQAAQQANRLQAQLDTCLRRFVSAERQPDLARTLGDRLRRCAGLARTLPSARE